MRYAEIRRDGLQSDSESVKPLTDVSVLADREPRPAPWPGTSALHGEESLPSLLRDEPTARAALEGLRWPRGFICPHCGVTGTVRTRGAKKKGGYSIGKIGVFALTGAFDAGFTRKTKVTISKCSNCGMKWMTE